MQQQEFELDTLSATGRRSTVQAMKFNHSLQFNAVPEWSSKYIDYSALKKLIYTLEKESIGSADTGDETQTLVASDPCDVFSKALQRELTKISSFYTETESRLISDYNDLINDFHDFEYQWEASGGNEDADWLISDDTSKYLNHSLIQPLQAEAHSHAESQNSDHTPLSTSGIATPDRPVPYRPISVAPSDNGSEPDNENQRGRGRSGSRSMSVSSHLGRPRRLEDYRITLKRRCVSAYVSLSELRSYVELNWTGFSKALKKFDKIMHQNVRSRYLDEIVAVEYPFVDSTQKKLANHISEVVRAYSFLVTKNDTKEAEQELRLHLREHIVWERNTVWRDMIHMERKTHGTKLEPSGDKIKLIQLGHVSIPAAIFSGDFLKITLICLIFFALLAFPLLESTAQSNCLAVVVAASLLWATEAIPLFVTSLLVPFLIVVFRIPLDDNDKRMSAEDASKFIFSQMWSSVIMILLGGFTLAAALSKYQVAKTVATFILSRAGTDPRVILLTLMFVSSFLSMWISNVASPVLCYSLAQPLLRTLSSESEFAKSIILGIALAANIGGMISPIASPQNIIALENMHPEPSWGQWFAVAIPIALVSLFVIWIILTLSFSLDKNDQGSAENAIGHMKASPEKFTFVQWFITFVTIATIVLWCFSHQLEPYVGEMGVLALIPVIIFFGTGLLSAADFNNFLWTIIALAMGGIALGKAVSSSGLLATIAVGIERQVHGMGLFGVMCVFGFMILVIATFVSHTVAALICLPLIESVGNEMQDPHPTLLVMASALLCSAAMGLPTSGLPNVTAICMTNDLGRPYLTVGNFITRGVLSSLVAYLIIISLGYLLMRACGF